MSDILTINTEENVIQQTRVEPLPLYDDTFPMLKQAIPEYTDVLPNPLMTNLVQRLKFTMKKFGGLGLAANQCGVYERVFIIGHEDNSFACINPKVVAQSEQIVKDNEGCLSFPGMYLKVDRPKSIEVEFTDENGNIKRMTLDGLTARCYLHELDHLNGIKFTDHVGPVSIRLAKQRQQKMVKKVKRAKDDRKNIYSYSQ
jgi:peptide deformylase